MEFLTREEIAKLKKILITNPQFQSPKGQENFLKVCGLKNYIGRIQLSESSTTFIISIFATLSEVYQNKNNLRRLGLLVFLDYIITDADDNLDEEERIFIQQVIDKCNQWEKSKQKPPKTITSPPPIQPSININKPPATRPQAVQVNKKSPSTQPTRTNTTLRRRPVSSVNYHVKIVKKTWFILLPIVVIWFFVGVWSSGSSESDKPEELVKFLIIVGSFGGSLSGLCGWIAWSRTVVAHRPIQWEQAFWFSIIGLISGAIGWVIFGITLNGIILNKGNLLAGSGMFFGAFFGLIVVIGIFGWLSLNSPRT